MKVNKQRTSKGRFKATTKRKCNTDAPDVIIEHNYSHVLSICKCKTGNCPIYSHRNVNTKWHGRRIMELDVMLKGLRYCQACNRGPIPLTYDNVVGELKKGLGGFLHVMCMNVECCAINKVPYGKTHHIKSRGMPCFEINTKLGIGKFTSIIPF